MVDDERAQHYRDEAERCRRLADAVRDSVMQLRLQKIALNYERLALQTEELGQWGEKPPQEPKSGD